VRATFAKQRSTPEQRLARNLRTALRARARRLDVGAFYTWWRRYSYGSVEEEAHSVAWPVVLHRTCHGHGGRQAFRERMGLPSRFSDVPGHGPSLRPRRLGVRRHFP